MKSLSPQFSCWTAVLLAGLLVRSSSSADLNLTTATVGGVPYEYVYLKAANNKPTLLFLHGFPSSLHSWRHQIRHFSSQGYGCLAPNLMGYGRTHSPPDYRQYSSKIMVDHLLALLDHVGLNGSRVFVLGHDWGARTASRFVLYHPERTIGAVLLSVAYTPPLQFHLEAVLNRSLEAINYTSIGYWRFFAADDAPGIIERNVDSFIDIIFANDSYLARTDVAPEGKIRDWVSGNRRTPRAPYMTQQDYATVRSYLATGMQQKLNWFKVVINNVDWDYEKNINGTVKRPVLFMEGKRDYIGIVGAAQGQKRFISDLKIVSLDTGHWMMEERPDEVNRELDQWIKANSASTLCLYLSLSLLSLFSHIILVL